MKSLIAFLAAFGLLAVIHQTPVSAEEGDGSSVFIPLGDVTIQVPTEKCGLRTLVIQSSVEVDSPDKAARVEAYMPKLTSYMYVHLSELAQRKSELSGRDVRKMIKKIADAVLGKGVVGDALLRGMLTN